LAILVVHRARKDSHASRPGQALRGSSELHGWGDSNLYLRRRGKEKSEKSQPSSLILGSEWSSLFPAKDYSQ